MDNVLLLPALDLNVFEIFVKSQRRLDTATLAKQIAVGSTVLLRILRALNAMGAVEQVGRDIIKPTKFSRAFAIQKGLCGAKFPCLAEKGYRNPSNQRNAAVQLAFNAKAHYFDILQERPGILGAFATYMTAQRYGHPDFPDFFPVDRKLAEGFNQSDKDAVLFVDVRGGKVHETLELKEKLPNLPGRMIVQDRPEVIREITGKEGMEVMEHDFFKPQPVKGEW